MVSAMNLHPLTPEQKNEYTRIAYYYYEAGQTQDQIAQRLGISRQRVNRILAECIERGIVRITLSSMRYIAFSIVYLMYLSSGANVKK